MYYNKNAGDITKWTYVADTSQPAVSESHTPIQPLARVTIQAGPRNKFNLFWDEQKSGQNLGAGSSTNAPETASYSAGEFQRVQQATWTYTATSKLLLEAGVGTYLSDWGGKERPGNNRDLIQVTEQCTAGCATNGSIPGLNYRAQASWLTGVDRRAHVARVGVVRDRQPQHEGRVPGRLPRRRSTDDADDQPHLSVQQRHPEPAHRVSVAAASTSRAFATTRCTRRTAGPTTG